MNLKTFEALLIVGATCWPVGPAMATTYYVDFAGGDDAAAGTEPQAAWKHCPGDPLAEAMAGNTKLAPGDTVLFRGGVHYRGTIICHNSGEAGRPITYDGNTAGDFGQGRAIIDGSQRLTGWQKCTSQEDALGNPHWKNLIKVAAPEGLNVKIANMYDGETMLWPAQDPNLGDPFFSDDLSTFRPISSEAVTRVQLTDRDYFTQDEADYWQDAYLRLWGNPNVVRTLPITGFSPNRDTIQFPQTSPQSLYRGGTVYYAVMNHIDALDQPGEYVVVGGAIYLWPRHDRPIEKLMITRSVRRRGINIRGQDHITIRGFRIQKMTSDAGEYSSGSAIVDRFGGSHVVICDNEIAHNYSLEKEGAIRVCGGGRNVTIAENADNVILNPRGKALGRSRHAEDIVVRNNILDGWGGGAGEHVSHNIYTSLFWNQKSRYGWQLGTGESVVNDKAKLFIDLKKGDFHLLDASPAIDAGIPVGLERDVADNTVPSGVAPDIGVYEYQR